MSEQNGEGFRLDMLRKGAILNCTGRSRHPHALRIRIEDFRNGVHVDATNLETGEQTYLGVACGGGERYFLMYRGEDFKKVELSS